MTSEFAAARLTLLGATLMVSGCSMFPQGPDIFAIDPRLCTRQQVAVGNVIVRYEVGSTQTTTMDYAIREGTISYAGLGESNKIKVIWNGDEMYLRDYVHQGLFGSSELESFDGGLLYPADSFYIVVYSASPEHLDYALRTEDLGCLMTTSAP